MALWHSGVLTQENNEPFYYGGCVGVYRVSRTCGRLRGVAQEQQNSAAVTTADFVPGDKERISFTTATVCHQCEDAVRKCLPGTGDSP